MIARKLGLWAGALMMLSPLVGLVGCGSSDGSNPEATGVASSALILTNPTPPYAFPEPVIDQTQKDPFTCEGKLHLVGSTGGLGVDALWATRAECGTDDGDRHGCQNYVAIPATHGTDHNGVSDPHSTPYTHGTQFDATSCNAGDLSCQLQNDFSSISKAQGFKYNVKRIINGSIHCENVGSGRVCGAATTTHNWFLQGLQRPDQETWHRPWHYQGVAAPWTDLTTGSMIDPGAHPVFGNDRKSFNWLALWNLAYTYSATGPNSASTQHIESEHHQCAAVFVYNDSGGLVLYDFLTAVETHDPIGNPW